MVEDNDLFSTSCKPHYPNYSLSTPSSDENETKIMGGGPTKRNLN